MIIEEFHSSYELSALNPVKRQICIDDSHKRKNNTVIPNKIFGAFFA